MHDRVVSIARQWLGTPYHHQASLKGVGCDCIGLVRGVWRELYGAEPEPIPAYTRDWAEAQGMTGGRETLLDAARRHMLEVAATEAQPGSVLIFRWRPDAPAKHCAVLATLPLPACRERGGRTGRAIGGATMIHALEGGRVCEVSFSPWWRRRVAGAFAFPEVSDPLGLTPVVARHAEIKSCAPTRTPSVAVPA